MVHSAEGTLYSQSMPALDLIIRGGTIYDGTGAEGVRADLGIRDGRIAAIGDLARDATTVFDAGGLAVAPGFVDIHTHYDAQVLWDERVSFSPWHGVTTCVVGNCGFGIAPARPRNRELLMRTLEKVEGMSFDALREGLGDWSFETFPEYLDLVDRKQKAINIAVLCGHTPIRLDVMGDDAMARAATADEVSRMAAMVDEAVTAGAVGFSTSQSPVHVGFKGLPVPSRFAEFSEVRGLAAALKGRGVMQMTVSSRPDFEQFAELTRASGTTVTWTALLTGLAGPDSHRRYLQTCIEMQRAGVPFVPQVACRPLQTEFQFSSPFSFERAAFMRPAAATLTRDDKIAVYRDPAFRAAFKADMDRDSPDDNEARRLRPSFHRISIDDCETRPHLNGVPLAEEAARLGVHPVDLALDLAIETNLEARFHMPLLNDDEEGVRELLQSPAVLLGLSDAGAHVSQMYDTCYATYLLGHWVRETGALTLPEAIRMLTSRPAEVFGLSGVGRLRIGGPADVAVFDPRTVTSGAPERVHDLPAGADRLVTHPSGIALVVVNGTIIRRDGRDTLPDGARQPGRLLRRGKSA